MVAANVTMTQQVFVSMPVVTRFLALLYEQKGQVLLVSYRPCDEARLNPHATPAMQVTEKRIAANYKSFIDN